jgi:spermidine/putrescine transport system ATP-binding protein
MPHLTDRRLLELENISKYFPSPKAVDGISLTVARGEFFALLGPSGCGKTTTLRLIAGFEDPTSGQIRLNGARIQHLKPYQRNVSTVFQNYALFPHLTVRENVAFGLKRKARGEIAAEVRKALDLVRLPGKEDRYPSQISGGERQRVALARSLVLAPDVLLLDEPLSALDPNLRREVRAELKELQRRTGVAFLFVTHDREEALALSDRIAVMNAGKLEQVAAPEELYLRPRTRFVAEFLGAVNWIGNVGVRPEATRIAKDPPDNNVRSLAATVTRSSFLGSHLQIEARLAAGGDSVMAEVSRLNGAFHTGDSVHIWWHAADELHVV